MRFSCLQKLQRFIADLLLPEPSSLSFLERRVVHPHPHPREGGRGVCAAGRQREGRLPAAGGRHGLQPLPRVLQKWAAHLADPELESSEDEEELLNPVLYVHDTLIPVGGDNLPRWCAARCPVPALCNDPTAA
eukprot:COSAG04_NODE_4997_length_1785_cov_28.755042_2_plen_133_part_00